MTDRDTNKKVRTVTYVYLICLMMLVILYPACRVEQDPPAMLEISAVGVPQTSGGRALQAVLSDPDTCTSLGKDSEVLVYDDQLKVFTCSMTEPERDEYVIVVKDLDGDCFGAVSSADLKNGELVVRLRETYALGQKGPAGGVIFEEYSLVRYLDSGFRYLEAFPLDSVDPQGVLTHNGAVKYCDDAVLTGKADWFLPSVNQLKALKSRMTETMQGYPPFWSGDEGDDAQEFLLYRMDNNTVLSASAVWKYAVWPVRRF